MPALPACLLPCPASCCAVRLSRAAGGGPRCLPAGRSRARACAAAPYNGHSLLRRCCPPVHARRRRCLPAHTLCCPRPRSMHGNALKWLVWVEDSDNEHIYHSGKRTFGAPFGRLRWLDGPTTPEQRPLLQPGAGRAGGVGDSSHMPCRPLVAAETWVLAKKMMREGAQRVAFTVPIFEPLPSQVGGAGLLAPLPRCKLLARVASASWTRLPTAPCLPHPQRSTTCAWCRTAGWAPRRCWRCPSRA